VFYVSVPRSEIFGFTVIWIFYEYYLGADPLAGAAPASGTAPGTPGVPPNMPQAPPPPQHFPAAQQQQELMALAQYYERTYLDLLSRPPYNSDPALAQQVSITCCMTFVSAIQGF
jgi:hypothetical protein